MTKISIVPGELKLSELRQISRQQINVSLADSALKGISESAQLLDDIVKQDRTVYGVNTGFGLLANTRIASEDLEELQRSIVLSHAAGIGKFNG